jgi:hypothetical protein
VLWWELGELGLEVAQMPVAKITQEVTEPRTGSRLVLQCPLLEEGSSISQDLFPKFQVRVNFLGL